METQYSSEGEYSLSHSSQCVANTFFVPEWPNIIKLINFKNRFMGSNLSDYTIKLQQK